MSLLDSLLAADLPEDALLPLRRAGRERLAALGLPGPGDERWRYSPLSALKRREFRGMDRPGDDRVTVSLSLLAEIEKARPRLVFVDGGFRAELSDIDGLPEGVTIGTALVDGDPDQARSRVSDAFVAANLALAEQGVRIRVAEQVRVAEPVQLFWLDRAGAGAGIRHHRIEIDLAAGSALTLVEQSLAEAEAKDDAALGNRLMQVRLAAGACFHHLLSASARERASVISNTEYRLGAEASVLHFELCPGGALYRHALDVELAGAGACFRSGGVQALAERRHAEIAIAVRHLAPDTRCDLIWRGLAEGRGRLAFGGRLLIAAGADGSDARMSSKNLLLSKHAEIDTRPVLEIYADEVKAAHGATVGSLDEAALFYLRSRGLPEPLARTLLTRAFAFEALAAVEDATISARAETLIAKLLPELADVG